MSKQKTVQDVKLENESVSIWKTTLLPNIPCCIQTKEKEKILIALSMGKMQIKDESGNLSYLQLEAHKAYSFLNGKEEKFLQNVNSNNEPIEFMVICIKGPKSRPPPSIPIH